VVHLPLAARSEFVSGAETFVKLGLRADAWTSDNKIVGERVGPTKGVGVCHFDAFQDGRFVQVEPVVLEVEVGSTESGFQIVKKMIVVYGHGFVLALVEASDAEVFAFLDLSVFEVLVPDMDGSIVERPGSVEMVPDRGYSTSGPRLAIAFERSGVVTRKVRIL
jgi:hypothetical protein